MHSLILVDSRGVSTIALAIHFLPYYCGKGLLVSSRVIVEATVTTLSETSCMLVVRQVEPHQMLPPSECSTDVLSYMHRRI